MRARKQEERRPVRDRKAIAEARPNREKGALSKISKAYSKSVGANSIGRGTGGKEWGISMREGCLEKG